MSLKPGSILVGRYKVLQEVGAGSAGTVYKVHEKGSIQSLALKQYRATAEEGERLETRLKELQNKTHPNLLRAKEIFKSVDTIYSVSSFAQLGNLYEFVSGKEDRMLGEPEALKLFKQMLVGLSFMLRNDIKERRLVPENILISTGILYISDYGRPDLPSLSQSQYFFYRLH
jgi:serine/threonine protein kinase